MKIFLKISISWKICEKILQFSVYWVSIESFYNFFIECTRISVLGKYEIILEFSISR